MPRIDLITPVKYQSGWPYEVDYDNLPLDYILARQDLINAAVDQQSEILNDSIGTAGTLSNRLNQSIENDGSLKSSAIDDALHNIGSHEDGTYDGIDYVRMKLEERDKLSLIANQATALKIQFDSISTISTASVTALFENETVEILNSDTINWYLTSPNKVSANLAFNPEAFHQHYYDLIPVHSNISSPNYKNYKVTSLATPFIEGSLKVYINGIRISEQQDIYVYSAPTGPSGDWFATSYTSDAENGLFELSRTISASDVITIDFDISLV